MQLFKMWPVVDGQCDGIAFNLRNAIIRYYECIIDAFVNFIHFDLTEIKSNELNVFAHRPACAMKGAWCTG